MYPVWIKQGPAARIGPAEHPSTVRRSTFTLLHGPIDPETDEVRPRFRVRLALRPVYQNNRKLTVQGQDTLGNANRTTVEHTASFL